MTGLISILMLLGTVLCLLVAVAVVIYMLRRHIRPAVFPLSKNCCILVAPGKQPLYFDSSRAAEHFVKECSSTEVNWEVYTICNGKVINLGNSKDLKQIEI